MAELATTKPEAKAETDNQLTNDVQLDAHVSSQIAKEDSPGAKEDSGPGGETDDGGKPATEPVKQEIKSPSSKKDHKAPRLKLKAGKKGHHKLAKVAIPTPDSSSEESDTEDSSDTDESTIKRKGKKASKPKRSQKKESSSDSESASSVSEEEVPKRKKKSKKSGEAVVPSSTDGASTSEESDVDVLEAKLKVLKLQARLAKMKSTNKKEPVSSDEELDTKTKSSAKAKSSKKGGKAESKLYSRLDHVWDKEQYRQILKPSVGEEDDDYTEHAFIVRRDFSWKQEFEGTMIVVKSKALRELLCTVLKDCKTSVSLEKDEPEVNPQLLFMYLEDLRTYYRSTLKAKMKTEKKRKVIKRLKAQRSSCKALVSYLDKDFADEKKSLYPLIQAGNIEFELIWGLFKPGDTVVSSCYGDWDEPRCFRLSHVQKNFSMKRGCWYTIHGRYLEYDGKNFGWAEAEVEIDGFKGPKPITTLDIYPLKYHKDADAVKRRLTERGRSFVSLEGMQYKSHKGLAFQKDKKGRALKINVNGRVVIDPSTFRRVVPNYMFHRVADPRSEPGDDGGDGDEPCGCGDSEHESSEHGSSDDSDGLEGGEDSEGEYKWKKTTFTGFDGERLRGYYKIRTGTMTNRPLEPVTEQGRSKWSDDELLLSTPVVLGFSLSDKKWLEFTVAGISDVIYNDAAFDTLMLPEKHKDIVKALVESHKFDGAKTIDDVVVGKGKGLVSVLHGPPGTGKTLTAEGIAELLRCPLYAVSAGELGTDPSKLEDGLQTILDIAHSWGAILLLDEADVFLEKREIHDVQRNALVSIFLRLLEYFQGILFLTTNRVDTFDEAFQSRIHLPLRYAELTAKSKKSIWNWFFEAVRKADSASAIADFSDHDLDVLSRRQLNGRQIKNCVRTAQALALRDGKKMDMGHVKHVLDVNEEFMRDLKGGTGYTDAMRSYM